MTLIQLQALVSQAIYVYGPNTEVFIDCYETIALDTEARNGTPHRIIRIDPNDEDHTIENACQTPKVKS